MADRVLQSSIVDFNAQGNQPPWKQIANHNSHTDRIEIPLDFWDLNHDINIQNMIKSNDTNQSDIRKIITKKYQGRWSIKEKILFCFLVKSL